ncbi:hypothetical protein [Streptomyces somaliensis]|uniref:hypothetical protein n=1 Tax=Streptomyces somaliensis TaxID=78355 RepID=UPI0034E9651F|nr:hypothetical protein [Streptomyces somaliensis]
MPTQAAAVPRDSSTVDRTGPRRWRSRRTRSSSSCDQLMLAAAARPRARRGNRTGLADSTRGDSCTASSARAPVTGVQPGPCSAGSSTRAQSRRARGVPRR